VTPAGVAEKGVSKKNRMSENPPEGLLLALEGGGTRSQAVLMDRGGRLLGSASAGPVNTNFVSFDAARQAVLSAVQGVLQSAAAPGTTVSYFISSLVGPHFGGETFGALCPQADYLYYHELQVVFARAGLYRPHGVGLVAATGSTAWGVRSDDGRELLLGGWGALLGDQGSAYDIGQQALRAAVLAYEGRSPAPTGLVEALCLHFNLDQADLRPALIELTYQKPLSRAEIAALAPLVARLAGEGDAIAGRILAAAAADLADLALSTAGHLFAPAEAFDVVAAGGLLNAGDLILAPLRERLHSAHPAAAFHLGLASPAESLARLALANLAGVMNG
jgi:N-acetylglucosamine kinase-like BadF-type ATPase